MRGFSLNLRKSSGNKKVQRENENRLIIFFSFSQLMEDIQIGALGHCAVQHATMELKIAVAHAQVPRLQTAANHVQGQVEKCGYARTLLRAHFQVNVSSDTLTELFYKICFHVRQLTFFVDG